MSFTSSRRDLWLLVGARAVSWLGDEVALVALTLRLQSDGHGAGAVAALLIANLAPVVLLTGPVGRLVDSVDNRRLIVLASALQAAVCTVLAFASAPAAVLALIALLGAGAAVNSATWTALVPATVPAAELPRALGLSQALYTVAGIIAPALGGLLTGWYGTRVPLLLDAATFCMVLGAALALSVRRAVGHAAEGPRPQGGLAIVRRDALLAPLFVLLAVLVLIGSMVNVVNVFLVRDTLHASTTWYGVVGASFAVGMLCGALAAGRLSGQPALARGFVAATVLLACGLAGAGLAPSVGWLLPICVATGVGNGILNVTLSSMVMGRARESERGRVGAVLNGVASGTQLMAFAAAGLAASVLSPRAIFVAAGVLALSAPLLFGRRLVRAADAHRADSVAMSAANAA